MSANPSPFDRADDFTSRDEILVRHYVHYATPVDALAYSETFERLFADITAAGETRSRGDVYRRLLSLRMSGRLPRLAPASGEPGEIRDENS